MVDDHPPAVFYQVVGYRVAVNDETGERRITPHAGNIYADEDTAEREAEGWMDTYEEFEQPDDDNPWRFAEAEYDVEEKHIGKHRLGRAEWMDMDRWRTQQKAMDAVAVGVLGDEFDWRYFGGGDDE